MLIINKTNKEKKEIFPSSLYSYFMIEYYFYRYLQYSNTLKGGVYHMKFLPPELVTPNIIPLNFIYDKGKDFGDDTLTIIFKDNISNQKSSYTIKQPVIEAYFV